MSEFTRATLGRSASEKHKRGYSLVEWWQEWIKTNRWKFLYLIYVVRRLWNGEFSSQPSRLSFISDSAFPLKANVFKFAKLRHFLFFFFPFFITFTFPTAFIGHQFWLDLYKATFGGGRRVNLSLSAYCLAFSYIANMNIFSSFLVFFLLDWRGWQQMTTLQHQEVYHKYLE